MSSHGDVVGFARLHGLAHDEWVAGVEAAGDICMVDQRDQVFVGAAFIVAVG